MTIRLEAIDENREKWLELKKSKVGSSEIAQVCGISRWGSPLELWAQKTGKIPPKQPNLAMWMGTEMEPITGKLFAKKTGLTVSPAKCLVEAEDNNFAICSPDFWVNTKDSISDKVAILEAKFVLPRNRDMWEDGIPPSVLMQLNWQLGICKLDIGWAAAVIGGDADEFIYEEVEFSEPLHNECLIHAEKFIKCIREDIPPEAGPGDSRLIAELQGERQLVPVVFPEDKIQVFNEWERISKEKAALSRELNDLNDIQDAFKAKVLEALGPNKFGKLPDGRTLVASKVSNKGYEVEPFSYVTLTIKKEKRK